MQRFTPMFKLLYCEQPPWLRKTAPCTEKVSPCLKSCGRTGSRDLSSGLIQLSPVSSVQKPPCCLTFAEVYPHKDKWHNFGLNPRQFKIKSWKCFHICFSRASERSVWLSTVLTFISILEHTRLLLCLQWVQLLFKGLRREILRS